MLDHKTFRVEGSTKVGPPHAGVQATVTAGTPLDEPCRSFLRAAQLLRCIASYTTHGGVTAHSRTKFVAVFVQHRLVSAG